MGQGVSEVLPFAIGIAISPIPIVAVILILFSRRARTNGPTFLLGWVLGLAVVSTVVYVVADAANAATDPTSSDTVSWIHVALGVLLLGLARRQWARRPKPGEQPAMPRWMDAVEDMTPLRALALAVALAAVNPKNLVLAVAAAAGLAQVHDLSTVDVVVALVVFVAVASLSVAAAVGYDLFGGTRARSSLDEMRSWLTLHNAAVMATLFLVFGVALVAKGVGLLSA